MGTIVRAHSFSDGAVARPEQVNENENTLYNEINGNLDWDNIKAALVNAANGFVKLDASGLVPTAQIGAVVDSGIIVMWAGLLANIPTGWSLCDGTGGTPDLRDKFVYGVSAGVDPGGTGGAATHTHTYSDLPSHTHGVGTLAAVSGGAHTHGITDPGHYHTVGYDKWSVGAGDTDNIVGGLQYNTSTKTTGITITSGGAHTHTLSGLSASAGVGSPETDAGSTLPPYYKLAFIQKD